MVATYNLTLRELIAMLISKNVLQCIDVLIWSDLRRWLSPTKNVPGGLRDCGNGMMPSHWNYGSNSTLHIGVL